MDNLSPRLGDVAIGDLNDDRDLDLVVTSVNPDAVHLISNEGKGTFCLPIFNELPTAGAIQFVAIDDFDGDGFNDLATANESSDNVSVLINLCVRLGDVNLDGQIDLLDIAPFVDLLASGKYLAEADINGDDSVDLLDIAPFVELLSG